VAGRGRRGAANQVVLSVDHDTRPGGPEPGDGGPSGRLNWRRQSFRLSLRNRLALVFFLITLLAVGSLYLYVAPGLQSRLMGQKLTALASTARTHSLAIDYAVGSSTPLPEVRRIVTRTAGISGDRVALLSVNRSQGALQLAQEADSGGPPAGPALRFGLARRAVNGRTLVTGIEAATPTGSSAG